MDGWIEYTLERVLIQNVVALHYYVKDYFFYNKVRKKSFNS